MFMSDVRFPAWKVVRPRAYASLDDLLLALMFRGIAVADLAIEMLKEVKILGEQKEMKLVSPSLEELGFALDPRREDVYIRAEALGLGRVSRVGGVLALVEEDFPGAVDQWLPVGMDPIMAGGLPNVFSLCRTREGLFLGRRSAEPGERWHLQERCLFVQDA